MRWGCVVLAILLAGCSGAGHGASDGRPDAGLGEDVRVEVTDTTGAVRGVVVDEAIRPLAGADITLLSEPPRGLKTGPDGTFAFSGLDPGTYFVQASKPGFKAVQGSADAVAGDRDPPVTKLVLVADPGTAPYHVAQSQTGYIMCTTAAVAVCGAPGVVQDLLLCPVVQVCVDHVTPDRYGLYFFYDANASLIQNEMVWASTQPVSPDLTLSAEDLATGNDIEACPMGDNPLDGAPYGESVSGPSPVLLKTEASDIETGGIGGACPIFFSVFSSGVQGMPVGVTLQQQFDIYSDAFYGYLPPEDWRLTDDGAAPEPT